MARVLIVDDEANQRNALAIALKLEGFATEKAGSASEALRMVTGGSIDAALLDLMMPTVCGVNLAKLMYSVVPGVPVWLMSAYHLSPQQVSRLGRNVVGFVPKPYRLDELVETLRVTLKERESVPKILNQTIALDCIVDRRVSELCGQISSILNCHKS
jgi:DNA-binding NtrC family response regulator